VPPGYPEGRTGQQPHWSTPSTPCEYSGYPEGRTGQQPHWITPSTPCEYSGYPEGRTGQRSVVSAAIVLR
jgi:hypothetical protein